MGGARGLALAALSALLGAQDPAELLARVDRLRNPLPAYSVEVELQAGQETQRWEVQVRDNGDARVDGISPKEKGRSVLMLGDEMWLIVSTARRPIRVSPQQRLMGPASSGDLARTRFASDYAPTATAEELLEGTPCWRVELAARRPAVGFRSARLWVAKAGGRPLRTEFLLPSGKVGRTVRYGDPATAMGRPVLSGMTLEAPAGPRVELRFSHWNSQAPDPRRFILPEVR